jgi:hypothetical protein
VKPLPSPLSAALKAPRGPASSATARVVRPVLLLVMSLLLAAVPATSDAAPAGDRAAATAPSIEREHDKALDLFRRARFAAACGRFIELAEAGHAASARYALWICENGSPLFGTAWDCATHDVEEWRTLGYASDRRMGASGPSHPLSLHSAVAMMPREQDRRVRPAPPQRRHRAGFGPTNPDTSRCVQAFRHAGQRAVSGHDTRPRTLWRRRYAWPPRCLDNRCSPLMKLLLTSAGNLWVAANPHIN